mgnify:CR=1 FL=1
MTEATQNQISTTDKTDIDQIATEICQRGLRTPAVFLLESGPLFPFLGSQLLWIAQPALSLFLPSHKIRQAAELLETPSAITRLCEQLRTKDETRES